MRDSMADGWRSSSHPSVGFGQNEEEMGMFGMPSLEVLEANHEFPCCFTFKAIGAADDNFVARVLSAVRQELPEGSEPSFSTRATAAGRHICVTIEPSVDSAAHVIEIYQSLKVLDGLVMLF
ncbi:MAG: DUF493 domain-containing protein [Planctomycetaceae bacterium]